MAFMSRVLIMRDMNDAFEHKQPPQHFLAAPGRTHFHGASGTAPPPPDSSSGAYVVAGSSSRPPPSATPPPMSHAYAAALLAAANTHPTIAIYLRALVELLTSASPPPQAAVTASCYVIAAIATADLVDEQIPALQIGRLVSWARSEINGARALRRTT
jgi:hypothetical protein